MNTINTVAFSGGLGSALAAVVVKLHVDSNPVLLHTDTKFETDDTYTFMDAVASFLGLEVTYVADGRTPEELFWDEHLLGNDLFPVCSHKLKGDQCDKWILTQQVAGLNPTIFLGMLPREAKRMDRLRLRYQHMGAGPEIPVMFPLVAENGVASEEIIQLLGLEDVSNPKIDNEVLGKWFEDRDIAIPSAYGKGLSHNNCRG